MRLDIRPAIRPAAAPSRSSASPEPSPSPGVLPHHTRSVRRAAEPGTADERVAALTEHLLTCWEEATGKRLVAVLFVADDSAADRPPSEPRAGAARRAHADRAADGAPPRPRRPLTAQQLAVARLVAAGCTNAEIGERLGIRTSTARNYVAAILERLGVPSRGAIGARLAADE